MPPPPAPAAGQPHSVGSLPAQALHPPRPSYLFGFPSSVPELVSLACSVSSTQGAWTGEESRNVQGKQGRRLRKQPLGSGLGLSACPHPLSMAPR